MGLVILVTIFALPFNSNDRVYSIGSSAFNNLGTVQSSGDSALITYTYIWVIAFILLLIAGVVGIFPLGTGILGIVGMAMITAAPSLVYPNGGVTLSPNYGYYVIWAASVIALIASFWHGKKQAAAPVNVNVSQTQVMGAPQQQGGSVKCPNCGATVSSGSVKCPSCGTNLK